MSRGAHAPRAVGSIACYAALTNSSRLRSDDEVDLAVQHLKESQELIDGFA